MSYDRFKWDLEVRNYIDNLSFKSLTINKIISCKNLYLKVK